MNAISKNLLTVSFSFAIALALPALAQEPPGNGMPQPVPQTPPTHDFVSHVGSVTGHADKGKEDYRRWCIGCHGPYGDGNGENAPWIDPKPRDFTAATFKCRSTPTGTLPTDEDLYNSITRGFNTSNMPQWRPLTPQTRADLIAYVKTFSPRWKTEKPGEVIKITTETPVNIESIARGKALFVKLECWKCHGPLGRGDGPSAATLTDSKDMPIKPYNFSTGGRLKCGETNADIYRDFMTGVDGTPMPSFADNIKPDEAWDLVHFLRTLQTTRPSKENEVLKAAGGKIPVIAPPAAPPAQESAPAPQQEENKPPSGGN
jgi:mono/diheme cytochrome c family protein